MTESADQVTLYRESGVGRTALLWSPIFALTGLLVELISGGPRHTLGWVLVAAGLVGVTAPWVYARRTFLSVRLTRGGLWQGREELAVERIAAVTEVDVPVGARVLGGGATVPRKYAELPLRLNDGTVVLAWARDVPALRSALSRVVDAGGAQP